MGVEHMYDFPPMVGAKENYVDCASIGICH